MLTLVANQRERPRLFPQDWCTTRDRTQFKSKLKELESKANITAQIFLDENLSQCLVCFPIQEIAGEQTGWERKCTSEQQALFLLILDYGQKQF